MREHGPARDFLGYGANPPQVHWPSNARIAINLNLNVEAGGERSILEGDLQSENLLTDIGFPAYMGKRSPMVESAFEYGPRVGCWRLLRIFKRFDVKASILGVVRGLQMYPELARAFVDEGHEVVSHGWRWIDYHTMNEKEEREHIRLAVEGIKKLLGEPPVGWFNGRPSINTRRLLVSTAAFSMTATISATQLPFWTRFGTCHHLVIPYSLETNDNRFDFELGLQYCRRVRAVHDRLLRLALRRGGGAAENHERGAARSADRATGPSGRAD